MTQQKEKGNEETLELGALAPEATGTREDVNSAPQGKRGAAVGVRAQEGAAL